MEKGEEERGWVRKRKKNREWGKEWKGRVGVRKRIEERRNEERRGWGGIKKNEN